jgi:S1-C subfamily serine protease
MRIKVRNRPLALLCTLLALGIGVQAEEPARSHTAGQAWLGVWLSDAVDGGAQINAVVGGGPAEAAGVRSGDVVLQANGHPIGNEVDLGGVLRELTPGDPLILRAIRTGQSVELSVTLGVREETLLNFPRRIATSATIAPRGAWRIGSRDAGLEVEKITPALRLHFGAPETAGVLVTRVVAGLPAAEAGLKVGDVLVRVAGNEIRTPRELRVNLVPWNHREPIHVEVVRERQSTELTVVPATPRRELFDGSSTRKLTERHLALEIERLERRLAEVNRELERLREQD